MTQPIELPKKLQSVYDLLAKGNAVAFADIHDAIFDNATEFDQRLLQQRIGPYIARLNRRLDRYRMVVKPGVLKGTYTLQRSN